MCLMAKTPEQWLDEDSNKKSEAILKLFKWLNRRSQRTSFNWAEFNAQLKLFKIPLPRITESRQMRLAVS